MQITSSLPARWTGFLMSENIPTTWIFVQTARHHELKYTDPASVEK